MQYFPLFVDTQQLKVLIVGAGEVACRKLDLLSRTQAKIQVIGLSVSDEIKPYASHPRVSIAERAVTEADIDNWDLIYLATADLTLNKALAALASAKGIWVNVVDSPEDCRFITPSIIDRDKLQIAISTAGAAPVFARELRARLESWLPRSLAPLFDFVAEKRPEVQDRLPDGKGRRLFWERFFKLNADRFDDKTEIHYEAAFDSGPAQGSILLIAAETQFSLLPIAALSLLQKLDRVYSDEAIPFALNELLRRDASRSKLVDSRALAHQYAQGESSLVLAPTETIKQLKTSLPMAQQLMAGSIA